MLKLLSPTKKLFYLPITDEWQMFDLEKDPNEMNNVYNDPNYASERSTLEKEYQRLRMKFDAPDYEESATKS